MAETPEEQIEIKIKVEWVGDGIVRPTSGATGSVNPDGATIAVHLFYDKVTLAEATYHPVSGEGRASIKIGREEPKDSHLTRSIHSSTFMTPHAARIIGEWLIEKSKEAGQARALILKQEEEANHEHDDTT